MATSKPQVTSKPRPQVLLEFNAGCKEASDVASPLSPQTFIYFFNKQDEYTHTHTHTYACMYVNMYTNPALIQWPAQILRHFKLVLTPQPEPKATELDHDGGWRVLLYWPHNRHKPCCRLSLLLPGVDRQDKEKEN